VIEPAQLSRLTAALAAIVDADILQQAPALPGA
jgi:hypothetical protein